MFQTFNVSPIPELQAFVNNIWIVEASGINAVKTEKMIPYGCMDLVFIENANLEWLSGDTEASSTSRAFITGQVTKPYYLRYMPGVRLIGFGFYPHTAHRFCGFPAAEFTDQLIPLELVHPSIAVKAVINQLDETSDLFSKLVLLQAFVLQSIRKHEMPLPQMHYTQEMVKSILSQQGQIDLAEFSQQHRISKRYIQRLFKDYVGVSPLHFTKIVRFLNGISRLQQQPESLSFLSYELGYYDQAHFIRDFKRFAGLSPTAYLRESHELLDQFTDETSSSFLYNQLLD